MATGKKNGGNQAGAERFVASSSGITVTKKGGRAGVTGKKGTGSKKAGGK